MTAKTCIINVKLFRDDSSNNAICVELKDKRRVWLPRSQINYVEEVLGTMLDVEVPLWLAEKEELLEE